MCFLQSYGQGNLASKLEADREIQIQDLESQITEKTIMWEFLKKRLQNESIDQVEATVESVDLGFLQTDLAREEEVYNRLATRLMSLRTEQVAPARDPEVQVIVVLTHVVVPNCADYLPTGHVAALL